MISADSCTSDMISGDTAAIFSLNHSCLFLIAVKSCIHLKLFFVNLHVIKQIEVCLFCKLPTE